MRKTTNIVLLSLVLFAACSTDSDELTQQPPQKKSYPLTIEVTEKPLIQDGEEGSGSNRAAITTTSSLTAFKLDYVYNTSSTGSTSAVRDEVSGKWKENGSAGWPGTDATVNWYAYTDGTFNLNGGTPYISFIVDESSSSQKDLLVATASGTYTGTGCKLSFSFDHACSALRFYVKKANNLGSNALTVTCIRLCNVKKNGRYYFTGEWQSVQTDASYTLYSGSSKTINSGEYELLNNDTGKPYLFMIPQELTGWNGSTGTYVEVVWNYSSGTPSSGTAKIPLTKALEKGKTYNIKINIGTTTLTTLSN